MQKKNIEFKEITPFNPLDKKHLGESVAEYMLSSKAEPLPPEPFLGAGIYAIYYVGEFPLYEKIAKRNRDGKFRCPIYVGKAIPPGGRKGGCGFGIQRTKALYNRMVEHVATIDLVSNLASSDFFCRYLVVDDIWIPLAESLLIEMFSPIWNTSLDGFGNHNPGSGRYEQQKSPWDVLHPGRPWAKKLNDHRVTLSAIEQKVKDITARYGETPECGELPTNPDNHGNG